MHKPQSHLAGRPRTPSIGILEILHPRAHIDREIFQVSRKRVRGLLDSGQVPLYLLKLAVPGDCSLNVVESPLHSIALSQLPLDALEPVEDLNEHTPRPSVRRCSMVRLLTHCFKSDERAGVSVPSRGKLGPQSSTCSKDVGYS